MGVMRSVKNVTKGFSEAQIKVRNATSNDRMGPTGPEMAEIAGMTFNSREDFEEIMDMIDRRLNDKGKNWRHVFKSLMLLDYIVHEGSDAVVRWCEKNVYVIRTLGEFQYIDENGLDVGRQVRISAKKLTSLLNDEETLRRERTDRRSWKSRVNDSFGANSYTNSYNNSYGSNLSPRRPSPPPASRPMKADHDNRQTAEDIELSLAIAASKAQAEDEDRKRQQQQQEQQAQQQQSNYDDNSDLARAIKLSQEEEDRRKQAELDKSNASLLFDDNPTPTQTQPQSQMLPTAWNQQPQMTSFNNSMFMPQQAPQATGWNQGYQQQAAVDWFGNPIDQQQPLTTGFLNQQYQPTGFGMQGTGFNNPYLAQQQTALQSQQTQKAPQLQQIQQGQQNVPLIDLLDQSQTSQQTQRPQTTATTGVFGQPFGQSAQAQPTATLPNGVFGQQQQQQHQQPQQTQQPFTNGIFSQATRTQSSSTTSTQPQQPLSTGIFGQSSLTPQPQRSLTTGPFGQPLGTGMRPQSAQPQQTMTTGVFGMQPPLGQQCQGQGLQPQRTQQQQESLEQTLTGWAKPKMQPAKTGSNNPFLMSQQTSWQRY